MGTEGNKHRVLRLKIGYRKLSSQLFPAKVITINKGNPISSAKILRNRRKAVSHLK